MASDEQQIRELVATWMSATRAGDIDTVLSLMTDDVVFLVPGAPPFGKQKFAAAMKPAARRCSDAEDRRAQRNPGNPRAAATGPSCGRDSPWRSRLPAAAGPRNAPVTRSRCCRKVDGRWLLARDANMLTPVEI